ncbi:MAG: nucleotidyl transferase AbiEii/AbiGii toxin family protein [Candidatus Atribacteria bacterium]|nr:nucleotidyl transferase AbiEii/AbiGii toxin family protein [Candidatus Atribacteria bacterium]
MPQEIISTKTKANLEILTKETVLKNFYLAGGTGAALQLKHRVSLDLDFFTKKDIDTKTLIQKIKTLGKFSIERETENTLIGIFNGTRLSFLKYDYPLLFEPKQIQGINVADLRDIGCMKIDAISSRGMKRDFVDLFFICREVISLKNLLSLFKRKYKSVNYNTMHILKSLVYFEDAENNPMSKMVVSASWQEIKNFFKKEIKKINDK